MLFIRSAIIFCFILLLSSCASIGDGTKQQKQQAILNEKDAILKQLYNEKPDTRAQIKAAAGYATFSNANIHLFFVSAGTGYGVVKNLKTTKHTYMNMAEGGVGLGLGAKDYRIVMIFHSESSLKYFIKHGWTFGGNADATAKAANKGGSIEGEAYYGDVTVYTFTTSGLALQATIKGTKFWKDQELNN